MCRPTDRSQLLFVPGIDVRCAGLYASELPFNTIVVVTAVDTGLKHVIKRPFGHYLYRQKTSLV